MMQPTVNTHLVHLHIMYKQHGKAAVTEQTGVGVIF